MILSDLLKLQRRAKELGLGDLDIRQDNGFQNFWHVDNPHNVHPTRADILRDYIRIQEFNKRMEQ